MYQVFNMGHRFEIYLQPEYAQEIISIANDFDVDAQIVGRVEASDKTKLTIKSEFGEFIY
jgi:phosphoribosylformylglycinamidine cyclo-ligase